ncbi:MAG: hypothetical protein ABI662_11125 [Dermatophilaceae bacterium]
MPAPRKYPDELRDRAQRLVAEAMSEDPSLSMNAAVKRIAPKVGVVPDTLRGWVHRAEVDQPRQLAPNRTAHNRVMTLPIPCPRPSGLDQLPHRSPLSLTGFGGPLRILRHGAPAVEGLGHW